MAIMKQIDECLTKAFDYKSPTPSRKWKAFWNGAKPIPTLLLFHYHHLVLEYDVHNHQILYEWWELPADKRGLDSAKEWLEERRRLLLENDLPSESSLRSS